MAYEFYYKGAPSSIDPNYGELFTGYRVPFSEIGAPTSIQTANQIQEVTNLLNQGGKVIELQPISQEVFEQIPKQHFKEIARQQKLAGAQTTMHAPMIDPAGFSKQGWSETEREEAERQLKSIIDRSHDLSPNGGMPITIHASAVQGTEYSKAPKEMVDEYKKQFERRYGKAPGADDLRRLEESRAVVINQETGQMTALAREEKYYPEEGKVIRVPEEEIKTINNSDWINNVTNLAFYKKEADEIIGNAQASLQPFFEKIEKGIKLTEEELKFYAPALQNLQKADLFLNNVDSSFRTLYNKAYKYSESEKAKEQLKDIAKDWEKISKEERKTAEEIMKGKVPEEARLQFVIKKSKLIDDTLLKAEHLPAPEVYRKIEDFAVDKAAKTLGNTAFAAFEKFKDKAPVISIENLFPGMAFSRSEELKQLVEESRNKFVENAVKSGKMDRDDAKKAAAKMIGVTWDVGHLNMLRKGGYTEEEIIKETAAIAPFVKHVHITDNFGFTDSHLPPGMGNVPVKQILEKLEKEGFKGKKIIEAGGFVQHFKTPPTQYVLEAMGSPLYPMMQQPYWNQAKPAYGSGNYFAGYGTTLPEQHFSMYGAGFASLPQELGGQMPGKQSRMGGAPMD